MRITLKDTLVEKLVALPESGMGFQYVDLMLGNGRIVPNIVVLNAEIAEVPDDLLESDIVDVRLGTPVHGSG